MALPAVTVSPDLIGLDDKQGHIAAVVQCDWTANSSVSVNTNSFSFQGSPIEKRIDRVLVDNTQNKGIVTVGFLGLQLSVSPYQRQNISLPDKVNTITVSGTIGQCTLIFSNGGELAQDTLNNYLSSINAGTTGLFAVNKYNASQALTSADLNKTLVLSSATAQTLTFPSIANTPIANGIIILVQNTGTGTYTLTPDALDNFNGGASGASITIPGGDSLFIVTDGIHSWFAKYIAKANPAQTTVSNVFTADQVVRTNLILQNISNPPVNGQTNGGLYFQSYNSILALFNFVDIRGFTWNALSGSETGRLLFSTYQNGAYGLRFWVGAGLFADSVPGGDMGDGTVNAKGLYVNGIAVGATPTPHYSYLTTGTSFTSNANSKFLQVTAIGGGGGSASGGGPGGGAGLSRRVYRNAGNFTYTYAIGAAGTNAPTSGGSTTFTDGTNLITANGGGFGNIGSGGGGGGASGGDLNLSGSGSTNGSTFGGSSPLGYGIGASPTPTGFGAGSSGSGNGTGGLIEIIDWY
jgi:hypothetical protein